MLSLCVAPHGATVEERFDSAISSYKEKYGYKPQVMALNPKMLGEYKHKAYRGVLIEEDEKLKLGDIWMKVE